MGSKFDRLIQAMGMSDQATPANCVRSNPLIRSPCFCHNRHHTSQLLTTKRGAFVNDAGVNCRRPRASHADMTVTDTSGDKGAEYVFL